MSNIDAKEVCGNCICYDSKNARCRKYAPRGAGSSPWPLVKKEEDWCSEFEWDHPEGKPTDQDHTE